MRHQSFPPFLQRDFIVSDSLCLLIRDYDHGIKLLLELTTKIVVCKMGKDSVRSFALEGAILWLYFKSYTTSHSGVLPALRISHFTLLLSPQALVLTTCACVF